MKILNIMHVLTIMFSPYLQKVFYFPLKPKLRALLRIKRYWNMCQHEFVRPRHPDILTDVYDGTAWAKFMGPCKYPNERIGLQGCGDGIPAFTAKHTLSLKPWMFMNLSLPPGSRTKPKYMLLFMLLQQSIKQEQQRKYFDFAAKFELNELYTTGIDGIKIKVFATSMDTKGREELSGISFVFFLYFTFCILNYMCPLQACRHAKLIKAVLRAPIRGARRSHVVVFMMAFAVFCRRIRLVVNNEWNMQGMCTNTRAGAIDQNPSAATLHLSTQSWVLQAQKTRCLAINVHH